MESLKEISTVLTPFLLGIGTTLLLHKVLFENTRKIVQAQEDSDKLLKALMPALAPDSADADISSDALSIDNLWQLTRASNAKIRRSTIRLCQDMIMADDSLPCFMGMLSENCDIRELKVLVMLCKRTSTSRKSFKNGLLKIIATKVSECLEDFESDDNMEQFRLCMIILLNLSEHDDTGNVKMECCQSTILRDVCTFLDNRYGSEPCYFVHLKYVLDFIQSLTVDEHTHSLLFDHNIHIKLGLLCGKYLGNFSVQRACLVSLLRQIINIPKENSKNILQVLNEKCNILDTLAYCIRTGNSDLMYWTIGMFHEYVTKDILVQEISSLKGLALSLVKFLSVVEDGTALRLALRIIKYCSNKNNILKKQISKGCIKFIYSHLVKADSETQYWMAEILFDFAKDDTLHEMFCQNEDGIKAHFAAIKGGSDTTVTGYLTDTLVFLTTSDYDTKLFLFNAGVIDTIRMLVQSKVYNFQLQGVSIIFNCLALSDEKCFDAIYEERFIILLSDILIKGTREKLQILSSRTLLSLALKRKDKRNFIWSSGVEQLVESILDCFTGMVFLFEFASDPQSPVKPKRRMSIFNLPSANNSSSEEHERYPWNSDNNSTTAESIISGTSDSEASPFALMQNTSAEDEALLLSDKISKLTGLLDCLKIFLESAEFCADMPFEKFKDILDILMAVATMAVPVSSIHLLSFNENFKLRKILFLLKEEDHFEISLHAVNILCSGFLVKNAIDYLHQGNFFPAMYSVLNRNIRYTFSFFSAMVKFLVRAKSTSTYDFMEDYWKDGLIQNLFSKCRESINHYRVEELFYLTYFCDNILVHYSNLFTDLDYDSKSDLLMVTDNLVLNDSWSFTSVRSKHNVQLTESSDDEYYFEIEAVSDGIIQIGICNENCVFDAEGGTGVGDCANSYAVDLNRLKKWHASSKSNGDYGSACWGYGDVITVVLAKDSERGGYTINYLSNGGDLGEAFLVPFNEHRWYPAVTVSSLEGCRLLFNNPWDRFRHVDSNNARSFKKGVIPLKPTKYRFQRNLLFLEVYCISDLAQDEQLYLINEEGLISKLLVFTKDGKIRIFDLNAEFTLSARPFDNLEAMKFEEVSLGASNPWSVSLSFIESSIKLVHLTGEMQFDERSENLTPYYSGKCLKLSFKRKPTFIVGDDVGEEAD